MWSNKMVIIIGTNHTTFVSIPLICNAVSAKFITYLYLIKKILKYLFLTNMLLTYLNIRKYDFQDLSKLQIVLKVIVS